MEKLERIQNWLLGHRKIMAGFAVLSMAWAFLFMAARPVAADATSDALNSTVTLITSLLLALLPLFILVGVFSLIIGLFVGRSGIFSKMGKN